MAERYATYERLTIKRHPDGILEIVMGAPGKLNAADHGMHRELAEVWRAVDGDPQVSVALLRGAGRGFSAGGDLGLVEDMADDFQVRARVWKARDLVHNVINCSKPIVSAMHGAAVGAGLVAACWPTSRSRREEARIIDGHTRLGVAAGDHAAIVWPLLCGMAKAKYYLLLCETLRARRPSGSGSCRWRRRRRARGEVGRGRRRAWPRSRRCAGRSTRSTTGCARRGRSSMPRSRWSSSASPVRRSAEGMASLKEKRAPRFNPDCPF